MKRNIFFALILVMSTFLSNAQDDAARYYEYHSCSFKPLTNKFSMEGLRIAKMKMNNANNTEKKMLGRYFLVSAGTEMFNVFAITNGKVDDSLYVEYQTSTNWSYKNLESDTCLTFYTQFNLIEMIDRRYPILIGKIYAKMD